MKIFYDKQTINTPNPIARFAHRNRLARVISLIKSQVGLSKLIDYGCGSGAFIKAIQGINGIAAIGYEPFMTERVDTDSPIYSDYLPVKDAAPFDAITIFEAIEHLDETELCEFLVQATELLTDNGKILFSAPIEIGPALFLKEINRCILHKRLPENNLLELLLASLFGVPAKRATNIKGSHKGFDFRKAIRFLECEFGPVTIASYGPLPIGSWYGNSQVYFWLTKRSTDIGSKEAAAYA
jgi:SAM-dependent methyltransferase